MASLGSSLDSAVEKAAPKALGAAQKVNKQNVARGSLVAGRGIKKTVGWLVLTGTVIFLTLWMGVVIGPWALAIPVVYFAVLANMGYNRAVGAVKSAAE